VEYRAGQIAQVQEGQAHDAWHPNSEVPDLGQSAGPRIESFWVRLCMAPQPQRQAV
jgi:hypothetical protein